MIQNNEKPRKLSVFRALALHYNFDTRDDCPLRVHQKGASGPPSIRLTAMILKTRITTEGAGRIDNVKQEVQMHPEPRGEGA